MRQKGALCAGVAVVDVVVRPIRAMPRMGTVEMVDEIGLYPGGNPVNTSIDLARMGVRAGVALAIGSDGLGRFLAEQFSAEGVETGALLVSRKSVTGSSVVMVRQGGERGFLHAEGANREFSDRHVPGKILGEYSWLHLGGYYLMPALDGRPSERLLERASRMGLETSLDVCWDPEEKWGRIRGCLRRVDWFMPSLGEAAEIFRERVPLKIAGAAFHAGVRRGVILKMGSEGSRLYLADGTVARVAPVKVRAVDATGAGDAFNAGFISARLRGMGPVEAMRAGSAAGALAVAGMGGGGNIRNWAQVKALAGRVRVATASTRRVEYCGRQ